MPRDYDAFISYTRQQGLPVAQRIHALLKGENFRIWRDQSHMRGGEDFWYQIEQAIERSHYLVMVITADAFEAGDRQVLRNEWLTARRRGCSVLPVYQTGLDFSSPVFPTWLRKLDCYNLDNDNDRIKLLNDLRTTPLIRPVPHNVEFPTHYVPRERERSDLVRLLMAAPAGGRVAITTAIRGAGGFGKTTLARALCFEDEILARYTDGVLWLTVGEGERSPSDLLSDFLKQLGYEPKSTNQETLFGEWKEALRTRQCLIVLDDVWNEIDALSVAVRETSSSFLITTRISSVASQIEAVECLVDAMTDAQSLALLTTALLPVPLTKDLIGRLNSLADRAGHWPVLLNLIANQLRLTMRRAGASCETAIGHVEDDLQDLGLTAFDRQDANRRQAAVASTVQASLKYLNRNDPESANRFLELAVFPDDVTIPFEALQDLWNLSPTRTRRATEALDDSGLVTLDLVKGIRIHDVLLHYTRTQWTPEQTKDLHRKLLRAWPDIYQLPHKYAWRWFGWHSVEGNEPEKLTQALFDLRWLRARLEETDLGSLLMDCHRAEKVVEDRPGLKFLEEALEKSAHVLLIAPRQLASQLYGRLRESFDKDIDGLLQQATSALATQPLVPLIQSLQPIGSALRRTLRHESSVLGALELRDGRLASWSEDGSLRLWSAQGEELAQLRGHQSSVSGVLELGDGRLLSWSWDRTLRLWSARGEEVAELRGHESYVYGALELGDGRLLSWSKDGTLRLWSARGEEVDQLRGHESFVQGALELGDGRLLSWSADRTLRLWSAQGDEVAELRGHESLVSGGLELGDGRLLSCSWDQTLRLWSAQGEELGELRGHESLVSGALELGNGRLLSWSRDRTLRLWSAQGEELAELRGHESLVSGALELGNGRLLSWSSDQTLRLWSAQGEEVAELRGHEGDVSGALELGDGRLVSWSRDRTLRLWSAQGEELGELRGHESDVSGALELGNGRLLSWSADRTLRLWSAQGEEVAQHHGHQSSVSGALELEDGRLLSWSSDQTLRLWSAHGEELAELRGHEGDVSGALELGDGRLLSWSENGTLRLWSAQGEKLAALREHENAVSGALELEDGRLLSWSWDRTLRLWSAQGEDVAQLRGHQSSVSGALELGDGRLLSWSADRTLRLWSAQGEEVAQLRGHQSSVSGALKLGDGRLLSWSRDGTLQLWSAQGEEVAELRGHQRDVSGALELGDGRLLSCSWDRTLRLWSAQGEELAELRGHENYVYGALELRDGRLLSWSGDRTVRLWSAQGEKLAQLCGHESYVYGVLELGDSHLLSWSEDRTLRLWDTKRYMEIASQFIDAVPTVVVKIQQGRVFVGDALGTIHVFQLNLQ